MDILGNILGSMEKPPTKDKKEKDKFERQKKEYEKIKNLERNELNRFRTYVEERLGRLVKDDKRHYMEFQPLDQVHRSIVHDVAETAGLSGISFGIEGADRYIVVYKKEHLPSEDELTARRNGEPWNKETEQQYIEHRRCQQLEQQQTGKNDNNRIQKEANVTAQPPTDYKHKYIHLIGKDSAVEGAKKTEVNRSYGYVPSENKKDVRSIEQTMADIQAKKKLKTEHSKITDKKNN
ncbi:sperm-associated antigen 7 [Anopheles ziemanni]|uniref:sperm-associated antigen 7 n=1 Tax=Anopheles coustani TaxID=139045 RepID=UPI002658746A|nr:sperm-associated antigen 7 [Anopheles coustani]XP_058166692.1 sperm-associated antigen 7 [Anopheles ziemanni]